MQTTSLGSSNASPARPSAHGVRVGLLAYTIWGFLTIYWKQLSAYDAIELIGWRMLFASAFMVIIVSIRGTWPALRRAFGDSATVRRLILAAVLLTVNWTGYVWAVLNDRVIEPALGYFLAPLATMAMGVFIFHETPTRAQRVAFGCAAIAVVLLTASYGRPPWIALLLAATWSSYGLIKRQVRLGQRRQLVATRCESSRWQVSRLVPVEN